jgi:hypothetical protein
MTTDPAPRPGFAQALGLAATTVRSHLRACLVLAAPYAILIGLGNGLTKSVTLDVGPSSLAVSEVAVTGIAIFGVLAVFVLLNMLVYPLTLGGLSMIGSAQVYGDAVDTDRMRRQVMDVAVDVIGAFLLSALILVAAPVALGFLAVVVATFTSATTGFTLLVFALAICVLPQIYVGVRLSLAVPIVIREGMRPRAALRRSWDLMHGTRWVWVFGVYLVAALVGFAAFLVVSALAGLVHPAGLAKFALDLVSGAVEAVVAVVAIGAATGVVYASLASEEAHVPLEVGAHEVLPSELPPS